MWDHLSYKVGAHPLKALSELNIFFCFVPSGIMWNHLTYKIGAHPLKALSELHIKTIQRTVWYCIINLPHLQ